MLQPATLSKWTGTTAARIKSQIRYVGVYIPTDISWSKQAEQLGKPGLPEEYQARLQESAFTAQVLVRFLDTVMDCLDIKTQAEWADVNLDFDAERQLTTELAAHWKIAVTTPTLASLKQRLAARVVDIWRFGRQETLAGTLGRNERFIANDSLNFDFVEEIPYARFPSEGRSHQIRYSGRPCRRSCSQTRTYIRMLRILVISDFHSYSKPHSPKSKKPAPSHFTIKSVPGGADVPADLFKHLEEQKIEADVVACCGDIVDKTDMGRQLSYEIWRR